MVETACICKDQPVPAIQPVAAFLPSTRRTTLRMSSRIHSLFSELLEVLVSVIQPLPSSVYGLTMRPSTLQPTIDKHAAQAQHLRSVLDPELIQQEIYHGVWDLSGLFQVIGDTLKCHCAPMRDRNVEAMIQTAQSCVSTKDGASLAKAIRMCFDVLELMKLVSLPSSISSIHIKVDVGHRQPSTAKSSPFPATLRPRIRTAYF